MYPLHSLSNSLTQFINDELVPMIDESPAVDRGLERGHFRGPKRATWVVAECDQISGLGR